MDRDAPATHMTAHAAAHAGLALILLNVFALNLGGLVPQAWRFFGLLVLGGWLVALRADFDFQRILVFRGLVLIGAFAMLLHAEGRAGFTVSGAIVLIVVAQLLRPGRVSRLLPLVIGLGCALFAFLASFYRCWPGLFPYLQTAARSWSGWLGKHVLGHPLQWGPTPLGLWIGLTFSCLIVARFLFMEWRPGMVLLGHLALAGVHLLYLGVVHAFPRIFQSREGMTLAPTVFLIIGAFPVVLLVCRPPRRSPVRDADSSKLPWVLALGSVSLLAAALACTLVAPKDAPRILFYSENEGAILDWNRPEFGRYGAYSQGMFGLLSEYLSADGFDVVISREDTLSKLSDTDVLVTINVNTDWTDSELRKIWSWVRAGGRLLVLGDHTDVQNTMASQNALLAPVGIELQFDGALASGLQDWALDDLFQHPIIAGVHTPSAMGIGLGASLSLSGRTAEPVFTSRYGLSDLGDMTANSRAFLGDYAYEAGEQLGDIVLVAWAPLGQGEVLVFGDTSGFQNVSLLDTYSPIVRNVFSWITGEPVVHVGKDGRTTLLLLAGLLGMTALWKGRLSLVLPAALILSVIGVEIGVDQLQSSLFARKQIALPIAWIDMSHAARINSSSESKNPIGGLISNLERNGYCVRLLDTFDSDCLRQDDILVAIAPAVPYSEDEVMRLCSFMDSGGLVIAATGYDHKAALLPLLSVFDLDIAGAPVGPIPLQRTAGNLKLGVEYIEAWPIVVTDRPEAGTGSSSPQVHMESGDRFTIYGSYRGIPLAVGARCGCGGLFLVGDSYFFSSHNLEDQDDYSLPNIHLLQQVLEDHQGDIRL